MSRTLISCNTTKSNHFLASLRWFTPSTGCQYRSYVRPSGSFRESQNGQRLLTGNTTRSASPISYAIPAAFVGAVGGLFFYIHYNDEKRAVLKGHGKVQEGVAPTGPTVGGPFTLINTDCEVVTQQDLRGKWVLLYFGYTSSPEAGPAEVQKLAKITDLLELEQNMKILPVFITLDPQRDSASHLKAYLKEFDSRIVGLTGPITAIKQMAQQYRVFFRKVEEDGGDYLVESSHNLYLINPNMEIVRNFGFRSREDEMIEDIKKELNKSTKT